MCAALYGREKSGKGDKVTVSLHHAAVYAPQHRPDFRTVRQPVSEEL
ncbi:MAG: hypothetical protein ACLUD2_04715 [Clostridium sp.]